MTRNGSDEATGPIEGDVIAAKLAAAEVKDRQSSEVASSDDASRAQRRRREKAADDVRKLRRAYAITLLGALFVQIVVADGVFYLYGNGNQWHIPPEAISAWLGATVIEVIGVVIVITRFLFSKDSFPDPPE